MDFLLLFVLPQRESQLIRTMISEKLTDLATASTFSLCGVIFCATKLSNQETLAEFITVFLAVSSLFDSLSTCAVAESVWMNESHTT